MVHCTDPNGYQREICRTLNSGGSFGSSPMEMTIGLGIYDLIEKIEITWPDGSLQTLVNPIPTPGIKVVQGNDQIQKLTYRTFTVASDGGHGAHHMNMDRDMRLTPLLIGSVILVMTSCGKSSRKPEYAPKMK